MIIAYLYHDLLNLYGESGNIKMIDKILSDNKIKHKILYLSLNDELNFDDYDLVYIGSGTERNELIALENLKKYTKDIKKYIESGKHFFVTGNTLDLFGKTITDSKKISALSIFDYEVKHGDRKMYDVQVESHVTNKKIYGFINNMSDANIEYNLFDYGFRIKNFIGTYIIGPILVRNPEFTKYYMNNLTGKKLKYDLKNEEKAYDRFTLRYKNGGTKQ